MLPYSQYQIDEKVDKLQSLDVDTALKLIWGWIKQESIDFKTFKILLESISERIDNQKIHDDEEGWG